MRHRARRRGARGAVGVQGAKVGGRAGRAAGACGARDTGAWHGRWACCWAVGCALGAFSLFLTRFDSVLFLSQFLDIVRDSGS